MASKPRPVLDDGLPSSRRATNIDDPHPPEQPSNTSTKVLLEAARYVQNVRRAVAGLEIEYFDPTEHSETKEQILAHFKKIHADFHEYRTKTDTYQNKELTFVDREIMSILYSGILDYFDRFYAITRMTEENDHLRRILEKRGSDPSAPSPTSISKTEEPPQLRTFAGRLEHYRKAAGLSQRALSAKAGLEQSHVSQLERSLAEPRLHTLINLADALDIDPCALIPKGRGRG